MNLIEFPTGKKYYPLNYEGHVVLLRSMFDTTVYKSASVLCKLVQELTIEGYGYNDQTRHMRISTHYTELTKIVSETDTPIFTLGAENLFTSLSDTICTNQVFKATQYQSCKRFTMISNMPFYEDALFSIPSDSLGITLHNVPYEGELIKTPEYTNVNRMIKNKCLELAKLVELQCILVGGELHPPEGVSSNVSKDKLAELLYPSLEKYLLGKSDLQDEYNIARGLGIVKYEYVRSKGYRLQFSNKPPKFPTGIRTRVQYRFGALTHPDNYMDWFDK